uniref:Me3 n=1 Tax=Arundo donax TaxID=35708 RepID=A0A0A9RCF7_ARUDO
MQGIVLLTSCGCSLPLLPLLLVPLVDIVPVYTYVISVVMLWKQNL